MPVDGGGHELTESNIDLSSELHGTPGDVIVVVSPTEHYTKYSDLYWANQPTITWVQVTSIGVDAMASTNHLIAWATGLRDGAPLTGVRVQLGGSSNSAVTDADGVARVNLVSARYLTASKGNDVAILPAAEYQWTPSTVSDSITGFAFDDRGIYRPGETVHVKGWFRRLRSTSDSSVTPLQTARTAHWSATDAFGHDLGHGDVALNAVSGFDLKINVPSGAALGNGQLSLSVDDKGVRGGTSLSFQIQEFRRPEFEVVTRTESAGPFLLTQPVTVAALAQYFSGGVLADAPTAWQVTTSQTTYTPPNWSQFTFGVSQPYWFDNNFGPVDARQGLIGGDVVDGVLQSAAGAEDGDVQRPHRHHGHALPAAQLRRREAKSPGDGRRQRRGHRREPPELRVEPRSAGAPVEPVRRHPQHAPVRARGRADRRRGGRHRHRRQGRQRPAVQDHGGPGRAEVRQRRMGRHERGSQDVRS